MATLGVLAACDADGREALPVSRHAVTVEEAALVRCPFCGFHNEDGALFCEQCKSDLSVVPPAPAPLTVEFPVIPLNTVAVLDPPVAIDPIPAPEPPGEPSPVPPSVPPAEPPTEPTPPGTDAALTCPAHATEHIKCPFCGYLNEPGALFCEQCKSDISAVCPAPAPTPTPVPTPTPLPQ